MAVSPQTNPQKKSLQTVAYEYIKSRIASCEYAPNQMLSEAILQEELGMSRTPVREAISRLSQEGLLTVYPKRGILVSGIGLGDINMLYEVRFMIEPHTLRSYGHNLDSAVMKQFAAYFHTYLENPTQMPLYEEDDRFHETILSVLPNIYLKDVYARIQTQNKRLRIMTGAKSEERIRNTLLEHLAIVDACIEKDWEGAADAMTAHIQSSKDASLAMLLESNMAGM